MARRYRLRNEHVELLVELAPAVAHKAAAGPCMHDIRTHWDYWRHLDANLRAALRRAGLVERGDPSWGQWGTPDPGEVPA